MNKLLVFALLIIALFSSCDKEPIDELIPFTFVNIDINLDLIQYQNLRNPGGYVYLDQEATSGYRGIILYHESSGIYRAFERACTFDPHSACDPIVDH